MVIIIGIGLLFMALIPNPLWGRLLFVLCAVAILLIGVSLRAPGFRCAHFPGKSVCLKPGDFIVFYLC